MTFRLNQIMRTMIVPILSAVVLFLCISSQASAAFGEENLRQDIPTEGLKAYFLQLSCGEATLIQTQNEENILVDTGSSFVEEEMLAFLNQQEIQHIDQVLITSAQDEHFGNFKKIYELYEPTTIYFPYYLEEYFHQLDLAEGTVLHPLQRGDTLEWDERTSVHILHPTNSLSMAMKDNSLVFQLMHDEQRFLFTSDISKRVEQELVTGYDLHSQILKVGDFGSYQATGENFLAAVDAHVAIIFHRPQLDLQPEVLERLEESWMDVYQVNKHGPILVVSQEDDYEVFVLPSRQESAS